MFLPPVCLEGKKERIRLRRRPGARTRWDASSCAWKTGRGVLSQRYAASAKRAGCRWDWWSSTWLSAICPVRRRRGVSPRCLASSTFVRRNEAAGRRFYETEMDRAVEGQSAVGRALTRRYRWECSLLSPARRPLFARFGLATGASGGTPLLRECERRRKDCCYQHLGN